MRNLKPVALFLALLAVFFAQPMAYAADSSAHAAGVYHGIVDWLTRSWPWIVAAVPTVITGLTSVPTGSSALDWFRAILSLFSVLTHNDVHTQSGLVTFKAPILGVRMPKKRPPVPGATALLALVLLVGAFPLAVLVSPGCAWWTSHGSKVEQIAVDCGLPAVKAGVAAIIDDVVAKLQSGGPDLVAQLDKLLAQVGPDILFCAVRDGGAQLLSSASGAGASSAASDYLTKVHHVTFKGGK